MHGCAALIGWLREDPSMNAAPIRAAGAAATVLALALPLVAPPRAESGPAEPGEAWESTVQMTMQGAQTFAMPAMTSTFCRPAGQEWTEPPAPEGSKCTMSDVTRSGNTMSWSMVCTEPEASGNGTMTFVGDASYTGEMTIVAEQGTMKMTMSGRRTGPCDAGAAKRQMAEFEAQAAQAQAQAAQGMAESCAKLASEGYAAAFMGPHAMCKEPAQLAAFCTGLATEAGYDGAQANTALGIDLPQAAAACGLDAATLLADLCAKALAADSFEFLAEHCPAESQALALRECAGREYTALAGTKYHGFCVAYAQAEMQAPQGEPATPEEEAQKTMTQKAKKGLKGLFGK
jgi:hypothetical protein